MNEKEPNKKPYEGIDNKYSLLNYSFKDLVIDWGEPALICTSVALAITGISGFEMNSLVQHTDDMIDLYNISSNAWHAGLAGLAIETGGHFALEVSRGIAQFKRGRL